MTGGAEADRLNLGRIVRALSCLGAGLLAVWLAVAPVAAHPAPGRRAATASSEADSRFALAGLDAIGRPPDTPAPPRVRDLLFVANTGRFDPAVRFVVPSGSGFLHLTDDAIWLTVAHRPGAAARGFDPAGGPPPPDPGALVLRLAYSGAARPARIEGFDPDPARIAYFRGQDPAGWRTNVPAWRGVRYVDLFPGVDLEVTGAGGALAQRLVVRAGAAIDLAAIRLRIDGADRLALDAPGVVTAESQIGAVRLGLPRLEAAEPGILDGGPPVTPYIEGSAIVAPFALPGGEPVGEMSVAANGDLIFSSILGGSGDEFGAGVALDADRNIYVTGYTSSPDLPVTPGVVQPVFGGNGGLGLGGDAFVAKYDPTGARLHYLTYLGGSDSDFALAIAVDSAGQAHITGQTSSGDFPTTSQAFQPRYSGGDRFGFGADAFVAKLAADGNALVFATYLGGRGEVVGLTVIDTGQAIAIGEQGQVFVAGTTNSTAFPVTAAAFQKTLAGGSSRASDGFVAQLDAAGAALIYSTYLGGTSDDAITGLALDAAGSAYVTGRTASADFPVTTGAFQTVLGGRAGSLGQDAFVVRLSPTGSALIVGTYLGGSDDDGAAGIARAPGGQLYLTGYTRSADFPTTTGAFQRRGSHDAFVAALVGNLAALVYSTHLGGTGDDAGNAIAIDPFGQALVTGSTTSADFPVTAGAAFQPRLGGQIDGFLVRLGAAGSDLVYSTYLGGNANDQVRAIATDGRTGVYLTGNTTSPDFPWVPDTFDTVYINDRLYGDLFVAEFRVPTTRQVDAVIRAPAFATGPSGGVTTIFIDAINRGLRTAEAVVVTATLPVSLTYQAAGPAPIRVAGNQVVWGWSELPFGGRTPIFLQVGVPAVPAGTRFSIQWEIGSAGPEAIPGDNSATTRVIAGRQTFLPIAGRGG